MGPDTLRAALVGSSVLLGASASCYPERHDECERFCVTAELCGLLPSALGQGDIPSERADDCEERCFVTGDDGTRESILALRESSALYDRWLQCTEAVAEQSLVGSSDDECYARTRAETVSDAWCSEDYAVCKVFSDALRAEIGLPGTTVTIFASDSPAPSVELSCVQPVAFFIRTSNTASNLCDAYADWQFRLFTDNAEASRGVLTCERIQQGYELKGIPVGLHEFAIEATGQRVGRLRPECFRVEQPQVLVLADGSKKLTIPFPSEPPPSHDALPCER